MGKQREWDGRGTGVFGWETEEEEDVWEVDLDFGGFGPEEERAVHRDGGEGMTISDMMEWRYFKAEREKEEVRFFIDSLPRFSQVNDRATSLFVKVRWQSNTMSWHTRSSLSYRIISLISLPRISN
jgi:hypothetical protein